MASEELVSATNIGPAGYKDPATTLTRPQREGELVTGLGALDGTGDWRVPSDSSQYVLGGLQTMARSGDQWAIDMLKSLGAQQVPTREGAPGDGFRWVLPNNNMSGVELMQALIGGGYQATPTQVAPVPTSGGGGGGGGTRPGAVPTSINTSVGAPANPGDWQAWLAANGGAGLMQMVSQEAMQDLSLDPMWRERMLAVADQMASLQGRLIDLNPELAGELDKTLAAARGEASMAYQDASDDLLLRAFAGGTQQSTIFGDAAGRLAYGQAQVERQIVADDAARRLGLRTDLTQQALGSLDAQAGVLGQGAQIDIAGLDLQRANREARLGLLDTYGRLYNSAADRYEQGREFGFDLNFRYKQLATQAALERASIAVQRMNAQTNARELALRDAWHTSDQNFAKLQWLESNRQWGMEYEQDERQISYGMAQDSQARRDAKSAQDQATWATIMLAFASDEQLKNEIVTLPDALEALSRIHGVSWRWKDTGRRDAGVIAQDVEAVLPSAVIEVDGVKHVFYQQVVGLLVAGINELSARVRELEAR